MTLWVFLHHIPDRQLRHKARLSFISDLSFNFPVGVFIYLRQGTLGNWTSVFRMEVGQDESHPEFLGAIVNATKDAPIYLSRRQTDDAVDTIMRATGRNKRLCKSLLTAVLPDGNVPQFNDNREESMFLEECTKLILSLDDDTEKELITDMRSLNIRGNDVMGKFDCFWEACSRVLDLENGSGAHHRRHSAADAATTKNVSYAPGILSIAQLIRRTVKQLEVDGKVRGEDFSVPSLSWVYLQFSPNNEYSGTAANHTGVLPYVRKMLTRSLRNDSHPAAHWSSAMKKYWRHHNSHMFQLFTNYHEEYDGDDDMVPCEKPTAAVIMVGCDDKSNTQVGNVIPLEATKRQ